MAFRACGPASGGAGRRTGGALPRAPYAYHQPDRAARPAASPGRRFPHQERRDMTLLPPALVYGLCLLTSVLCAGLLVRAWRRDRSQLLLWTAAAFGFFALNNLALVLDMLVFVNIELWPARMITNLLGFGILLYGFVWETGR